MTFPFPTLPWTMKRTAYDKGPSNDPEEWSVVHQDLNYRSDIMIRSFRDGYTVDFSGRSFTPCAVMLKSKEEVLQFVEYILTYGRPCHE